MIKAAQKLNSAKTSHVVFLFLLLSTYVTLLADSSELATIKSVCERVADVYAAIGVLPLHDGLLILL